MVEIKKIGIGIILILFISGCAATPKTVKPTTAPEQTGVIIKEQVISETTPIIDQPVAAPIVSQPMGITYSQITNLISEFIDIQPIETASGESRFLGISESELVSLEIIGDKDNISLASMKLAYPEDITPVDADLNRAMMLRFLRNALPEFEDWPGRVRDIINRFDSIDTGKEEDRIALDGKTIEILYDKNTESIAVTLRSE